MMNNEKDLTSEVEETAQCLFLHLALVQLHNTFCNKNSKNLFLYYLLSDIAVHEIQVLYKILFIFC